MSRYSFSEFSYLYFMKNIPSPTRHKAIVPEDELLQVHFAACNIARYN